MLGHLGFRDFVLLEEDVVETTNFNRMVTADAADVGTPKAEAARRRLLSLDPTAAVTTHPALTPRGTHRELLEVDLILGCVDDDGPRYRLNQLAVHAGIPYVDIATGVDTDVYPPATGARPIRDGYRPA